MGRPVSKPVQFHELDCSAALASCHQMACVKTRVVIGATPFCSSKTWLVSKLHRAQNDEEEDLVTCPAKDWATQHVLTAWARGFSQVS